MKLMHAAAALLIFATGSLSAELSVDRGAAQPNPTVMLSRSAQVPAGATLLAHIAINGAGPVSVTAASGFELLGEKTDGDLRALIYHSTTAGQGTHYFTVTCASCDYNAQLVDIEGTAFTQSAYSIKENVADGRADYMLEGEAEEGGPNGGVNVIVFQTTTDSDENQVVMRNAPWAIRNLIGNRNETMAVSTSVQFLDVYHQVPGSFLAAIRRSDAGANVAWMIFLAQ